MSADTMTPGRAAYEEDRRRRPTYPDGRTRPQWDHMSTLSQWTWERNPTPRDYSTPAPRKPLPTVTITDSERVIWTGPYQIWEDANRDGLSVSELYELGKTGRLEVGGGAAPHLIITLSAPLL